VIFSTEQDTPMTEAQARLAATHRSAAIIVLALALSIMVYTVAGILLGDGSASRAAPEQSRMMFIVIAVLLALASIGLRRTQLSPSKLQAVVAQRGIEGLIKHFFTTTLILAALAEGIGILSILVSRFGGSKLDVITFGLVAGIILFSNFPRRAAWERAVTFFASNGPGPIG
jgi:hypothetical protein